MAGVDRSQAYPLAHGGVGSGPPDYVRVSRASLRLWTARDDLGRRRGQQYALCHLCRNQVLFGQLGLPNSGAFGNLIAPTSGSIFAFQVLPTIIFISAFFAVLYHIGVMQIIIRGMAWVMLKTMRISGAESMNVAASIFMGQTEAPLTIRPFLSKATRSELMAIMTSGMAHVSGGIMAMYISQGVEARHLLSAVIMTSPGTILIAKMLVPETEVPATEGKVVIPEGRVAQGREPDWRHCARHHRRRQAGDECGHHADQFSGAGGAARQHAGLGAQRSAVGSGLAGADSRVRVCAGGVADRRAVARLHGRLATCWARAWR